MKQICIALAIGALLMPGAYITMADEILEHKGGTIDE